MNYHAYQQGQGHIRSKNIMALHPRQNSTFAFDVVFTFYVCCPLFDITVSQCDIELATLEFHDATLKLSPPKFYLRFRCHRISVFQIAGGGFPSFLEARFQKPTKGQATKQYNISRLNSSLDLQSRALRSMAPWI